MKIDHVTIAGRALAPLRRAFAALGLETEYGGPHSNQITHMDLLGFDDGSYIELISTLQPGAESPWWDRHIAHDGGPCAWAVRVDDIEREAARVAALGLPVEGPTYYHRRRPDGTLVEWDLAFLGDHEAGAKLPFLIADRTPRHYRVRPSPGVSGSELAGVEKVVLGVERLEAAVDLFRRVYGWPAPEAAEDAAFGARLAGFGDQPVILAEPLSADTWLADRLARLGESPCAYLLGSRDFAASLGRGAQPARSGWFRQRLAWFPWEAPPGTRLGVIETP